MAAQMVIHALCNRVRCGWGSYLQVIDNIPKFMAENEMPPLVHPSVWQPEFVKLLHSVEGIFDGSVPDLTHGGLYWADLRYIEREWFKTHIIDARKPIEEGVHETAIPQHMRVADLNNLSFWA